MPSFVTTNYMFIAKHDIHRDINIYNCYSRDINIFIEYHIKISINIIWEIFT